jgi:16S rRNA (uracil1498-N3)-methyltransferase
VNNRQELTEIVGKVNESTKYILSPHHTTDKPSSVGLENGVVLLIGPEGGFTENEVALANSHGFQSLLIGKRILRAETAAITGISLLQHKFGDF